MALYAAYLLLQRSLRDYVLLEAREVLEGRIVSVPAPLPGSALDGMAEAANCFDLGPSWFWPGYQRELDRLVDELGLARFAQFEDGDMVVERSPHASPERMRGYASAPPSMRLMGMAVLIDALRRRLEPARIFTGHTVRALRATDAQLEVESVDASGRATTRRAAHVLLGMPPRLVEARIVFSPTLPETLSRQWRATPTWMAPHAKYLAIHDTPSWRAQGLSGEARSTCGPLGEIHDASIPGGSAAPFGFFGVPASIRKGLPEVQLQRFCRAQLARLFGREAATPGMELIQDLGAGAMRRDHGRSGFRRSARPRAGGDGRKRSLVWPAGRDRQRVVAAVSRLRRRCHRGSPTGGPESDRREGGARSSANQRCCQNSASGLSRSRDRGIQNRKRRKPAPRWGDAASRVLRPVV